MSVITKRWEPDGLDALSPAKRMALSIVVTGVMGFLLEYIGTEVLHAFSNNSPYTLWIATGVWAFGLGPLLVFLRKANILVPMVIVAGLFAFLVLFNHNYFVDWQLVAGTYREIGLRAPRIWEFTDGKVFGLSHPLLIALVGGAIESVVVPASLWTQKLLTLGMRPKGQVPVERVKEVFENSVTPVKELKPKRGFGFLFMRFIVFAYGIYFVYQIIGLTVNGRGLPILSIFFLNPAETLNTFMKITLMLSLATVGAFNAGVRREASILLLIGHAFSVGASLWLYYAFPVNPLFPDHPNLLLASVAGDGVLIIVLIGLIIKLRRPKSDLPNVEDIELRSPASTLLRTFLFAFGCIFTLYTIGIVYFRINGSPEQGLGAVFGGPDPLVSNSITKYGTVAAVSFFLFKRPSMRRYFMPTLIIAFMVTVAGTIAFGLQGNTVIVTRLGPPAVLPWFMMLHIIVDGGALVLMLMLRRMQYHVDYQITSLRPASAECVMALHRSIRPERPDSTVAAREVLGRIDEHIVELRGRRRGLFSFPFWLVENLFPFLLWLRAPFSTMSREEQRWMLRRYLLRPNYERAKSCIPPLSKLMYQIGDIVHALVTLGYFSSERGQQQVGYVPPNARERLQKDIPTERPPDGAEPPHFPSDGNDPAGKKPLSNPALAANLLAPRITVATGLPPIPDEVDYCIVGSGAAGGVIAHRLAMAKGKDNSICVLERGGHYSPVQDFSDDEMRMIRMLYAEGGLQISRSFDFTVLQGECVGGTTVINNAICFRMPERSRREWAKFGIDVAGLDRHYDLVQKEINIDAVNPNSVNHKVESLFARGVEGYNAAHNGMGLLSPVARIAGNFSNCVGCGLCNIGCRRMRKLSVLETYVPWAMSRGVIIIPNVGAVQCETEGAGAKKRVASVVIRKASGEYGRIRIRKALIIAAGAISSSRFLMRSNLGGADVGKGISCNFAVPPVVQFPEPINAFDGLQMGLYAAPESFDAIFEITFNPPGAHSIASPQYLDRHARLMNAYRRSVNFTALVGSDPGGSVSAKRDLMFGRAVEWNPSADDITRIKRSLITIAAIAKSAGAERVLLPTHPVLDLPINSETDRLLRSLTENIAERQYFNFITAHPQGGNLMGSDSSAGRVVDLDFKVLDCDNLFVCDASVFPRGVRVNPQWTIMALASAAGDRIAQLT